MKRVVDRAFTVRAPLAAAWDHLGRVERWPSWARHIRHASVEPPGQLGLASRGTFKLSNGMSTTFQMAEFRPQQSWKWVGSFVGATIHYDHVFEPVAPGETRIRFTVDSTGGLTPLLGGIFGWIYRRNLDRAIPLLTAEIEGLSDAGLGLTTMGDSRGGLMDPRTMYSIDTTMIPWEERFNEKIGRALFRKVLYTDPDSGAEIRLVRYPAGVINPRHTHPCGHGMYVLEGELVTHKGAFGAGSFVWFPEGEVMEHGASAASDVVVLFVTNKAFRIDYVNPV